MGDAVSALRRAVELDPDSGIANYRLGSVLLLSGKAKEACSFLRAAARLDAGSSIAHVSLGQALLTIGETDEAESSLRTGIALDHKSYAGHSALARLMQRQGRFKEAAASFGEAARLMPDKAAPYFGITYSKRITEDDRDLIRQMEALLIGRGGSGKYRSLLSYSLGKAYDDLGEYGAAIAHFTEANRGELESRAKVGLVFNRERFVQTFDAIKQGYSRSLFSSIEEEENPTDRPVFIIGMIRSGTTLVEQLLASHPQIATAGELLFWRDRGRQFIRTGPNSMERERLAQDYRECLLSASPDSRYVVDKMPLNFLALGLIHRVFPRAKIIHCRRDPADTCLSIYVTPYGEGPEFAHHPANIRLAYEQYRQLMDHWEEVLPEGLILNVDYEELVSDREAASRRMIEFLGLDWDEACLAPGENRSPVHTPSMWQVRQPIYRTSIGRWQHYREWLPEFATL